MNMTTEEKVKRIVSEELGVFEDKVVDDAKFVDDLGADELDFVELIMAIEEEFSICVSDEDAEKINTVGDLIAYVKGKL